MKLHEMMTETFATGKIVVHSKDEKAAKGAELAPSHRSFFTPQCLRRHLVSRQFNEKKAYEMMLHTLYWRVNHVPTQYVHDEYKSCVASQFMDWVGHDRQGRPSLFIKSGNADLDIPRETRLNYLICALEKGITLMESKFSKHEGVEQWNIVIDESHRTSKTTDNKFMASVAPILTTHYAQRLYRCYVINPGWMTSVAYAVIKMFLDEGTTSKIKMVHAKSDKNNKAVRHVTEILEDMGEQNVPVEYGGSLQHKSLPEYDSFFASLAMPKWN